MQLRGDLIKPLARKSGGDGRGGAAAEIAVVTAPTVPEAAAPRVKGHAGDEHQIDLLRQNEPGSLRVRLGDAVCAGAPAAGEVCLHRAARKAHGEDKAYAALAANEEERGDMDKALRYYLLVGSLFDDARMVPHALSRAVAILREMGREAEAAKVMDEIRKRFPEAPEAK